MLSMLLHVVGLLYGCLVIPTVGWSLLWGPGINSSHKNTLDLGEMEVAAVPFR